MPSATRVIEEESRASRGRVLERRRTSLQARAGRPGARRCSSDLSDDAAHGHASTITDLASLRSV